MAGIRTGDLDKAAELSVQQVRNYVAWSGRTEQERSHAIPAQAPGGVAESAPHGRPISTQHWR